MKTLKELLIDRRSVRRYERQAIEPEKLAAIYEAIRNTPTSYNGQQFSVVAVTDTEIKLKLYEIMGQKQVKTSAVFLLFCLDFHQLELAAKAKGVAFPDFQDTLNGYTVGVVDATLAMHQAVVAAEAQGLGTCCIGYARTADPVKTAEILGLPSKVAIVCGLAIGVPAETPDLKPKRPVEITVFENRYGDDEAIVSKLMDYDRQVSQYNRERAGDQTANDWAAHILDYHRIEKEKAIEDAMKKQHVELKLK
jgi:nitroreductase